MENFLIIPLEIADKLRKTEFPKPHALDPVKGEIDGKEVGAYLDKEGKDIEVSTLDTKTILTASVISK